MIEKASEPSRASSSASLYASSLSKSSGSRPYSLPPLHPYGFVKTIIIIIESVSKGKGFPALLRKVALAVADSLPLSVFLRGKILQMLDGFHIQPDTEKA